MRVTGDPNPLTRSRVGVPKGAWVVGTESYGAALWTPVVVSLIASP
ncbi:MAG: hypothetical protein ACR2JK_04915 [Geodermatophilaceae bacterium]